MNTVYSEGVVCLIVRGPSRPVFGRLPDHVCSREIDHQLYVTSQLPVLAHHHSHVSNDVDLQTTVRLSWTRFKTCQRERGNQQATYIINKQDLIDRKWIVLSWTGEK